MYEIDKQKFGAFVATLRREKGYTQKDLAGMLYISDKAISKWETGVSIPDITLLIPLSEALGVSVTELLKCRCLPVNMPMDSTQVEDLVKTAITYSEEYRPTRRTKRKNLIVYLLCILAACTEVGILHFLGYPVTAFSESMQCVLLLCPLFGAYFMLFALEKLPAYYDENEIYAFSDGFLRMNLPGVRFNNRNWPHIVKAGQVWSMGTLTAYPLLTMLMRSILPEFWAAYETAIALVLLLGGLFVPMIVVGRKYQES